MNTNLPAHNQSLEALAGPLVRPSGRTVRLLGAGWHLALCVALGCGLSVTSLSAQDTEPPVVTASLPDEGQPPAPSLEIVPSEIVPSEIVPSEIMPSEIVPSEIVPSEIVPAAVSPAEVATTEQVEQIAEAAAAPAEVRELSVEPVTETRPMLPANRPAWVGAPNDTSERIHRLYVASFTAHSAEEVETDDMLDEPLVAAVQRYLDETLFPNDEALPLPITADFVRKNLLDKSTSFVAAMTTQAGVEYQKWVVLQVTPEQRDYFAQLLREHKQRQRMAVLGSVLGSLLGLTALLNFAFNRRRRRYADSMIPLAMVTQPDVLGGRNENFVQHVAGGVSPVVSPVVSKVPRKQRSLLKKSLILLVAAGLVLAFMLPAFTIVKIGPHRPVRTEHIRIDVNGHSYEHITKTPFIEESPSDPN